MTATVTPDTGHAGTHGPHAPPSGWRRWVLATNHKDIGTLYLIFSFAMLLVGGVMALLSRAELFKPGLQIMRPEGFYRLAAMRGIGVGFGGIVPAVGGFG